MQHDEFIGQVQQRARLSSRGDAERASRATLETLGERVPEGLADNLAAQLPHEIGEHLRRTEVYGGVGTGERFDRRDFVKRVASRAGVDEPQAAYLARTVLETVDEATEGAIVAKILDSLPPDLRSLISAGSTDLCSHPPGLGQTRLARSGRQNGTPYGFVPADRRGQPVHAVLAEDRDGCGEGVIKE